MKKGLCTGLLTLWVCAAQAVVIVDFDGSANKHNARTADSKKRGESSVWNFSDTTAMFSSADGKNTQIYGGLTMHWEGGAPDNPGVRLENTGTVFTYIYSSASNPFMEGVYVWKKEDFLKNNTVPVAFNEDTTLSVRIAAFTLPNNSTVRFVVKQDGKYYVSGISHRGTGKFSLTDPNKNCWWAELNTSSANYTYGEMSSMKFTDVEAVGYYFEGQRKGTGFIKLEIDDFKVTLE